MLARLTAVAIGGQLAFVVSWLVAQALEPRYDPKAEAVSGLAAATAENAWIVTAGIVAWALGTAACGEALRRSLPRRRRWWLPVAAVWIAAAGMAALAALPLDCSPSVDGECLRRAEAGQLSWRHEGHAAASGIVLLATGFSPFALWLALRPGRGARIALACGLAGLILFQLIEDAAEFDPGDRGGGQRILLLITVLWFCALAVTAMRHRAPGPASPATRPARHPRRPSSRA